MKLSKSSIVDLSEALRAASLTHKYLEKICYKLDIPVDYCYDEEKGGSLENRLWALIENLNDTYKLGELIHIIVTNYGGYKQIKRINDALQASGYMVTNKGQVLSQMGKEVKLQQKLSEIEEGLTQLGFTQVLKDFQNGVENYGKGQNFQDIRRALEGLIHEIIDRKIGSHAGNIRQEMENLFPPKVLMTNLKKFNIEGKTMELEHAHAYCIYSLLSNYIDHYNTKTDETERHFVFFQSVGLIWLLVKRHLKNP